LRALSSAYVERRGALADGAALSGAGKRAAFALFYGPLHFLLIRHIAENLPGAATGASSVIDLGCGTGAAGAAWAAYQGSDSSTDRLKVVGVDRHPWAVAEAARTYKAFGLQAAVRRADITTAALPSGPATFLAAFAVNELADAPRDALLTALLQRASRGDRVLIVEPVAGFVARWWDRWRDTVESAGGRADEWRLRAELPAIVAKLDRAAGLDHRQLLGRSLWLGGPAPSRHADRDRSHSRRRSSGQQLTTRSTATPASRACAMAVSAYSSSPVECASLSSAKRQPASRARVARS
jgi:SAM-dependent methyltransferase